MNSQQRVQPTRFSDAVALGFRVFPLVERGKKPAVAWKKYQDEAPSREQLSQWDKSRFNIGIVTGPPSDIVGIDVDSPEAQAMIDELDLPPTPCVRTARGMHLLFKHPGFTVPNGTKIAGQKLDVRGDGGYLVGPGSIHPTGVSYEWITSPAEVDLAALPEKILALLRPSKVHDVTYSPELSSAMPATGTDGLDRFLAKELNLAKQDVSATTSGEGTTTAERGRNPGKSTRVRNAWPDSDTPAGPRKIVVLNFRFSWTTDPRLQETLACPIGRFATGRA